VGVERKTLQVFNAHLKEQEKKSPSTGIQKSMIAEI
jgi:hypothetical protein